MPAFRTILSPVLALFLSIALAGACRAELIFQTPAGVNPGQSFNVVFYDSIGSGATSANIADYNAAVTSAASNIQYSGGTIGSWSIIGTTATTDESATLFGSGLPVYDLRGNLLASNGGTYQSIGFSPSIDQTGALFVDYPVWTGLIRLGIPGNSQYTLGGGFFPSYGLSGSSPPADGWGGLLGGSNENYSPADIRGLYGYAVFTAAGSAAPEPSSLALAFMGLASVAIFRVTRCRGPQSSANPAVYRPNRLYPASDQRFRASEVDKGLIGSACS